MLLLNKRKCDEGGMNVEKISAITIKVNDMARSVHFYNRLLGLKVLDGGENVYFSSLQVPPQQKSTSIYRGVRRDMRIYNPPESSCARL
jgi:catechol 2,3-dioxygenase-like lactoylglutathione lyase family enzyme